MPTVSSVVALKTGGFRISDDIRSQGMTKLLASMNKYQLKTEAPKIVITGESRKNGTMGTDSARDSSIERYESVWGPFANFCFLLGDYESAMLPLRMQCPGDPFPVKMETAVLYMQYRVKMKGELLKHHKTDQPVKDMKGSQLVCLGDWKGKSSLGIFRSALSKLHSKYETTKGVYTELCGDCRKIDEAAVRQGEGCRIHPGKPQYWPRGNVTRDADFKTEVAKWDTYIGAHYESKSAIILLPGELRDIRTHLLSHNDSYHLMLWTIIIVDGVCARGVVFVTLSWCGICVPGFCLRFYV